MNVCSRFSSSNLEKLNFHCNKIIISFISLSLGNKYVQEVFENVYKVVMKLTIVDVDIDDFGQFKCVAKNSLGETDGSIKLYRK